MSESESFFQRANQLLDRLEEYLPRSTKTEWDSSIYAYRWQSEPVVGLMAIRQLSDYTLDQLLCIERQKQTIVDNTRQFLSGLPANNVLLWGPKGTGKSSLIKAVLNEFKHQQLKVIEVSKDRLIDLPRIIDMLYQRDEYFILYCDDLSFENNDVSYKSLKVVLDGSLAKTPDNVLIYASSNRRHLLPEYMQENRDSGLINEELHLHEGIEEKIALSERFGLNISFHPFNQQQYLEIVNYWLGFHGVTSCEDEETRIRALRWAREKGSRSGRAASQFARYWAGQQLLEQQT